MGELSGELEGRSFAGEGGDYLGSLVLAGLKESRQTVVWEIEHRGWGLLFLFLTWTDNNLLVLEN